MVLNSREALLVKHSVLVIFEPSNDVYVYYLTNQLEDEVLNYVGSVTTSMVKLQVMVHNGDAVLVEDDLVTNKIDMKNDVKRQDHSLTDYVRGDHDDVERKSTIRSIV